MNIGIQGIKGAFHEEAAFKHFGDKINLSPYLSFNKMVEGILNDELAAGLMAIENTISGTIHSNLSLIRENDLTIVGEEYLRIEQHLAVLPGTKISDLRTISSHYMALEQCRKFLNQYPSIQLIEAEDTAIAMKNIVDRNNRIGGAIGSRLAAKHYGLEILAENIETNKKNYTRFLVVTKGQQKKNNFDKASITVTLKNKKGALSQILSLIAFYDIDLSKIESAPVVGEPWHYRFYIDLLFLNIAKYKNMLSAIEPLVDKVNILGEYKSGIGSLNKIHELS